MCGCGTRTWCDGGCSCGCDHGTTQGMRAQGRAFASRYDVALGLVAKARADERALLVEKARNLVDRFIEHGPLCWDSQAQCTCGLYELADALDDLEKP